MQMGDGQQAVTGIQQIACMVKLLLRNMLNVSSNIGRPRLMHPYCAIPAFVMTQIQMCNSMTTCKHGMFRAGGASTLRSL